MDNEQENMVYTAAMFRNTNVAAIAKELGMSSSNLYRKMRLCTLKPAELAKIAKVLGGEYSFYFSFPNGTRIGRLEKHGTKNIKTA